MVVVPSSEGAGVACDVHPSDIMLFQSNDAYTMSTAFKNDRADTLPPSELHRAERVSLNEQSPCALDPASKDDEN